VREIIDEAAADLTSYEPLPGHRSQVEAMAGYGVSEADIAKVAENLYRKATGDGREAVTAAIFWLKTRARWKETSVHELGGASELPPLRIERVIIDPRERSVDHDVLASFETR